MRTPSTKVTYMSVSEFVSRSANNVVGVVTQFYVPIVLRRVGVSVVAGTG